MVPHFDKRINVDNSNSLYEEMKCAFQSLNYFKYKEYGGNIYEVPISYYDNPQKSISDAVLISISQIVIRENAHFL